MRIGPSFRLLTFAFCLLPSAFLLSSSVFFAQEYKANLSVEHPAIAYTRRPVDDAVARLARQLERGSVDLKTRGPVLGSLPDLLKHLQVNADSQMLVFSKTSFQASRISPEQPRAIYFNDEVAIAYVPGDPNLEVAALDPVLGPVFYTMSADGSGKPNVARRDVCLRCHQGPNTAGVPGIYVGSVIPGPTGAPLRGDSAIITDHRSAFKDRWGGWYVTATRGEQPDRANAVASNPADPETLVRDSRQNLSSLAGLFDQTNYLAPTSDIVALMTFEHQTQMINLMTRVGWQARIAAHVGEGDERAWSALEADVEDLVAYMLFAGEAPLAAPIEGVSTFARTFSERGPRDGRGRSLRDFDLQTRLFRYPLSYMVHSAAFDALPASARERIYRRLYRVLVEEDQRPQFAHLSRQDRRDIVEILKKTKTNLPESWQEAIEW